MPPHPGLLASKRQIRGPSAFEADHPVAICRALASWQLAATSRNNHPQIEPNAQVKSDAAGRLAGQSREVLRADDAVGDFDQAQASCSRDENERPVGIRD